MNFNLKSDGCVLYENEIHMPVIITIPQIRRGV